MVIFHSYVSLPEGIGGDIEIHVDARAIWLFIDIALYEQEAWIMNAYEGVKSITCWPTTMRDYYSGLYSPLKDTMPP